MESKIITCNHNYVDANNKKEQWYKIPPTGNEFIEMKRNEAIELLSKMLDDKVFPRSDYRQVKWLKNNIWNNKESKIRINKYLHLTKIASSHENQKHSFSIASYFFSVMWIVICASEWKYWKHQIESSWSSPWGKEKFFLDASLYKNYRLFCFFMNISIETILELC